MNKWEIVKYWNGLSWKKEYRCPRCGHTSIRESNLCFNCFSSLQKSNNSQVLELLQEKPRSYWDD